MITVDTILATSPCTDWPRSRIERALSRLDCASWSSLVESAAASRWRVVSLADLRMTACRHAAIRHQTTVLIPWVQHVTRLRVATYRKQWPKACAEVVALWDRLDAWDGTAEQAQANRADAHAYAYATTYATLAVAASVTYTAAADTAAAAADTEPDAYAATDAVAYAAADAAKSRSLLLDFCRRIDAQEVTRGRRVRRPTSTRSDDHKKQEVTCG